MQNQNLASSKTFNLLRLWIVARTSLFLINHGWLQSLQEY